MFFSSATDFFDTMAKLLADRFSELSINFMQPNILSAQLDNLYLIIQRAENPQLP